MEKNVLEFLENSQRMYGEKTACADMNNELTYTQLMNQAKFIGSCLSLKIKPTQEFLCIWIRHVIHYLYLWELCMQADITACLIQLIRLRELILY